MKINDILKEMPERMSKTSSANFKDRMNYTLKKMNNEDFLDTVKPDLTFGNIRFYHDKKITELMPIGDFILIVNNNVIDFVAWLSIENLIDEKTNIEKDFINIIRMGKSEKYELNRPLLYSAILQISSFLNTKGICSSKLQSAGGNVFWMNLLKWAESNQLNTGIYDYGYGRFKPINTLNKSSKIFNNKDKIFIVFNERNEK